MATAVRPNSAISDAEWAARQELASCYRVFAMLGWDESIYNHITLRIPGEDNAFLINPFGLHYSEVTASSLVKIDIDGNLLAPSEWPVNKAGFIQHSTFHRHLPDAHAVMHTHTTAGMAVASSAGGLQVTNFYAGQVAGHVAVHDFEGVTVRAEEGERLIANLGDKRLMILRNHGLLAMGHTIPAAFLKLWTLQRACEVQLATAALGPAIPIPPEVIAVHQRDTAQVANPATFGQADFAAMVRLVDRQDRSWRD